VVEINEEILDRDLVLSSLCVRPHYFAGFEGGAKAILPGCSSLKTISRNHSYVIGNSYARELKIDGNPVREDMNEVPGMLEKRGIRFRVVDFVPDSKNHPFKINYGDPVLAHKRLAEVSRDIYTVKGPATTLSITVADGSLGRTLYQATKAFSLTSNIMKPSRNPKSTVILLASLREGIGSSTWANEIVHYASMPSNEIIRDLELRAKKGEFNETLQKVNRFAIDCETIDLRVVSPEAPREAERLLSEVQIFFARELDEALEDLKFNGNIVLVPKGSSTVPIRMD
jgi:nickel-dependent lactate racemase